MEAQDRMNQVAWVDPAGVHWLESLEGFTDEGERAAYSRVAASVRNPAILDLGVGAGRTVALLRKLSDDYIAIDYTPALVRAARRRYPELDIRLGDARDLSTFDDEQFGLVVFSYMGIDSVDHGGRRLVLQQVLRVLKPQGLFWFSTLNMAGTAARERPWHPHLRTPVSGLRAAVETTKTLARVPRNTLNYLRTARASEGGAGWQIAPFFAYSYRLLVHYTTLDNQLRELREAGFREPPEVFEDRQGSAVHADQELSDVCCFNVLARKAPARPG